MEVSNDISGFREELLKEPYVKGLHILIDSLFKERECFVEKIDDLNDKLAKEKEEEEEQNNISPEKR